MTYDSVDPVKESLGQRVALLKTSFYKMQKEADGLKNVWLRDVLKADFGKIYEVLDHAQQQIAEIAGVD